VREGCAAASFARRVISEQEDSEAEIGGAAYPSPEGLSLENPFRKDGSTSGWVP